jgi:hypothetical protein
VEKQINMSKIDTYYLEEVSVLEEISKMEWYEVFNKVAKMVNYIWQNFSNINSWELAELKFKLSGYKFFLSDFVWELQRLWRIYSLQFDTEKTERMTEESEKMIAEKWKITWVEKDTLKDKIELDLISTYARQLIFENQLYRYKVKMSSIDDIITSITQRLSIVKREIEAGL